MSLLADGSVMEKKRWLLSSNVCVEQLGTLARDMRNVVAGFLENEIGVRICVGLLRAGPGFHWRTERRYWLCMRSLTELVRGMSKEGLGAPSRDMGSAKGTSFGKGSLPAWSAARLRVCVPA